jgi:triacylglycerol lipase
MPSEAASRPLVLVHGLLDTPRLFSRLERRLEGQDRPVLSPYLPHRFGATPLRQLAQQLDDLIQERWGVETSIDILGFSMGGVIARTWLQELGGAKRTHRFLSVGSPQQGTLTAQCVPAWLFAGLADMKRGSPLLRSLNGNDSDLQAVECISFFCRWDLMVCPGWQAVLPIGTSTAVPVWTHQQLMSHPRSLDLLTEALFR